jgi:mannose-6-phosphate isomerase
MIGKGGWSNFLRRVKVKSGDFFYVPSGTVHALCKGILVLETQQSSDTTYRLYDYDRLDDNGQKRELHLDKAIDVIAAPHIENELHPVMAAQEGCSITTFVQNSFFTVAKWNIEGTASFTQNQPFLLFSVIEGEGILQKDSQQYSLNKGMHFILPYDFGEFTIQGIVECIVSHV